MNTIHIPPLKIQGIKAKLVEFISDNLPTKIECTWYEPFMGSGVVGFNLAPIRAVFSDINPYVVQFYNDIKSKELTSYTISDYLKKEGNNLKDRGDEYYYFVRDRFNNTHNSLDFLFLNRSCFNGLMRFNSGHKFNSPFCHNTNRFSKSYITKITNQVKYLEDKFNNNDWTFICDTFENMILKTNENDFIYCDPPYIGRNVNYFDGWGEKQEINLHDLLIKSNAKFMVSSWQKTEYRENPYINALWNDCNSITTEHYYQIGAKEENRFPVTEILLTNYIPCRENNKHDGKVILF